MLAFTSFKPWRNDYFSKPLKGLLYSLFVNLSSSISSFSCSLIYFLILASSETISAIIGSAYTKATNVAVEVGILTSETTDILLGLAQAKMLALASEVSGTEGAISDELADKLANRPVAVVETVVSETPDEEEDEEEEQSEEEAEEEAAAGLGALFGWSYLI